MDNQMTHDELLKRIDRRSVGASLLDSSAWKSLHSIVELHKPSAHLNEDDLWCDGCYPTETTYPCPTIQIINKEL
jgi:hypothetical protein